MPSSVKLMELGAEKFYNIGPIDQIIYFNTKKSAQKKLGLHDKVHAMFPLKFQKPWEPGGP